MTTGHLIVTLLLVYTVVPMEAGRQLAHAVIGGVMNPEARRAHPVRYWSYTAVPVVVVAYVVVGSFVGLPAPA